MKQPTSAPAPSQAPNPDTLPAAGGSYLRRPDGSLERAVAGDPPPAPAVSVNSAPEPKE
jgi:hypothetical protein